MTGPREWRHAEDCAISAGYAFGCRCGLSAVRDAIAAGHRVVIGPDGALADPAPVGLTEAEREALDKAYERWCADKCDIWDALDSVHDLINIIDRLSAAPVDDRERVPEGWRVEWRGAWTFKEPGPPRPVLVPVSPSVDPEEKP